MDFQFNLMRHRKRSPLNSRDGAGNYEAVLRQRLARGQPIDDIKDVEKEPTFKQFSRRWFDEYVIPNNKHSEQKTKEYALENHIVPFFGRMLLSKITAQHVEKFKSIQVAKGLKNKTINNHLTMLSKCLSTAQDWNELENIPKIKWLKCPPPETHFLTHEDSDRLLDQTTGIWYEMILTALRTGLRRGELRALQWEDINWNNGTLTVRHSWCESQKGLVSPKSNKVRHIPLDTDVYTVLYQRRKKLGFVFANANDNPFDAMTMYHTLKRISRKAGLKNVYWHMLRHTFASHLAMANAPVTAIQTLMGHSDITTTMRYAHLGPSTLRSTVDLLSRNNATQGFGQQSVNHKHTATFPSRTLRNTNPELDSNSKANAGTRSRKTTQFMP